MEKWLARAWCGAAALMIAATAIAADESSTVRLTKLAAAESDNAAPPPQSLRHGVFQFQSYPAAWTAAQKTNRPILVFACSPSCPNCVRMLGETYQTQGVTRFVHESFETVYVDRYEQPDLMGKLHVRWFPTTIVVSPNNKVIDVIEGYVDAATFRRRLQTTLASQTALTKTR